MMRKISRGVLALVLLLAPAVYAAEVVKVKDKSVLINVQGLETSVGDQFYALSADGKKRGIIQITKIKGDKAIGHITKGHVEVGMTVELKGNSTAVGDGARPRHGDSSEGPASNRSYWGGMLGVASDSMSVMVANSGTANMKGYGFSAMAFFDYEAFPQIWFRGMGGVEGFSASGSTICAGTCTASLEYISLDFLGRYVFSRGSFRPWLGLGVALMFPAAKSTTALDSSSISSTNVLQVAGGFDWFISPTMYVPITVEYGMLPKSDQVDASWIEVRVGLAVPF